MDKGANTVQGLAYGYDAANNVQTIGDAVTPANSQAFGYDSLNRLTSATGRYGGLQYTYDANGNRLTEIPSVIPPVNPLDGLGSLTGLTYNQSGRLATVTAGNKVLARYTYDPFGRRLVKSQPGISTTTLYHYDRNGRLLDENNDQGNPEPAEYIYLDDGTPVATLTPAPGNLYFLHDDRLGTPQLATKSDQSALWTTTYQPFGETGSITGFIQQNLRLPGQYADFETGAYHNGLRDYAPGLGRYFENDPIGLIGGINTYIYVSANPLKQEFDFYGLVDTTPLLPSSFDPAYSAAMAYSAPGFYTYAAHGSSSLSDIVGGAGGPASTPSDDGYPISVWQQDIFSVKDVADQIVQGGWNGFTPIRLIVCYGAKGGGQSLEQQVAQELANRTGGIVVIQGSPNSVEIRAEQTPSGTWNIIADPGVGGWIMMSAISKTQ